MPPTPLTTLFQTHSRSFEDNRFVYAVVSRRSGGVSIGVNLNPDKYCNFDCVYCQVDRTVPGARVLRRLDLPLRTPDAINIAIAQRIDAALATFDDKMRAAATAIGVSIASL